MTLVEPPTRPTPPNPEPEPSTLQPLTAPRVPGPFSEGLAASGSMPRNVVILDDPKISQASAAPPATPPVSLVEAARAERERRRNLQAPTVRITNQNLKDFARGQKLTEVNNGAEDLAPPGGRAASEVLPENFEDAEKYWRERVRRAREQWAEAVAAVRRLEGEVARLRRDFYAADDPYDRDARIKPLWDRALEALREAQARAQQAPQELERILEEGRRAGALPGWLREGLELEPQETVPRAEQAPGEPTEPVLLEVPPS